MFSRHIIPKKIALSVAVLAASGAYIWFAGRETSVDPLLAPLAAPLPAVANPPPSAEPATAPSPAVRTMSNLARADARRVFAAALQRLAIAPVAPAATLPPLPRLRPEVSPATLPVVRAAATVTAAAGLADGTYTGPAVDAYYGIIQIQAVVQGGRLTGINVLRYPSDRRTSVAINRQALPMLRDEVISAQSADVDIISGATLTSEAFIASLRGALGGGSRA